MNWAFKISLVVFVLIASASVFSFQKTTSSQHNEADIKAFTKTYMEAFNERDSDKLTSLWAPDATYINLSTHETLNGKDEISDYFKEELKDLLDSKLTITIENIKFDESGKAIEKGTAITTSKDEPEKKSAFIAEWAPINDSWKLQKVLEIDIQSAPSHYEEMKDLEWLVGKWEGKHEYADLSLNMDWDENKNFLIQNFTVHVLDQKNLDGKQIIGWDPTRKKIRSWMIDSDGGFGEGFWNKQGDHWYVGMSYILPDGRKASATHIYTKTDDHTFTFASEDRDVNGKVLPNIKPFTITKMQ